MEENCIFCKIVNGDIPSSKVYEDDEILAFKDINPIAPVHILIIPKKHIENLLDLKEEDSHLVAKIHMKIQELAKEFGIDKTGFRVITNCGKDSGQEVFHLHFHLLGGAKMNAKVLEDK